MDAKEALLAFLEEPDAGSLADLAETLEEWPEAGTLVKLAARAVFLEDDRLAQLLEEAAQEAQRLLKEAP